MTLQILHFLLAMFTIVVAAAILSIFCRVNSSLISFLTPKNTSFMSCSMFYDLSTKKILELFHASLTFSVRKEGKHKVLSISTTALAEWKNTIFHASYQAFTRFLPPKSTGWDNQWLLLMLRVWYTIAKLQYLQNPD